MPNISKNKLKSLLFSVFRFAFLAGLIFMILYPQLDKIAISFRSNHDLVDTSIIFLPKHFVFDAFLEAADAMDYWPTFFRTLFFCAGASFLHVISCTMTAYSIAKFDFFGKKIVYACILLTFLVPPLLISLPIYTTFRTFDIFGLFGLITGSPINLLDKPISLLLMYATANCLKSGLFIYLLIQYFKNLPKVLDEAAEVDGANNLDIMLKISIPSARVMLVTVFLFSFVWQWTDTYYSSMFFSKFKVLSTTLSQINSYSPLADGADILFIKVSQISSASSIIFVLPLIVLYIFCNKAFVQGVERSGIVG